MIYESGYILYILNQKIGGFDMRISCADTSRARNNLESAATLGKQPAGLLGYIQTFNDNGELYVHYWWGRRFHAISDRRKIIFGENYIDLKYDRSTAYFLSECFIENSEIFIFEFSNF